MLSQFRRCFLQSKAIQELFKVLEKYHQLFLKENIKAAPDVTYFFSLARVKFLGHIIEGSTNTPLSSRIDPSLKFQPPSNEKKIQEVLGMLNFFK